MKNKNKGFTLIELLVVVAIIGILAAVGTVAYTGYTASAAKISMLQDQIMLTVVKYVAAEMAKCNVESTAFETSVGATMDWDDKALKVTSWNGPACSSSGCYLVILKILTV